MRRHEFNWWVGLMGFVIFLLTLAIVIYGVIADRGSGSEAGLRLVLGVVFAGMAFLPYGLLRLAARRTGLQLAALIAAVICFGLDIALRIAVVFFSRSSTDAVALALFPLWLAAGALGVWVMLELWNFRHVRARGPMKV